MFNIKYIIPFIIGMILIVNILEDKAYRTKLVEPVINLFGVENKSETTPSGHNANSQATTNNSANDNAKSLAKDGVLARATSSIAKGLFETKAGQKFTADILHSANLTLAGGSFIELGKYTPVQNKWALEVENFGNDKKLRCGDKATFEYTFLNSSGLKIASYNDEYIVGANSFPLFNYIPTLMSQNAIVRSLNADLITYLSKKYNITNNVTKVIIKLIASTRKSHMEHTNYKVFDSHISSNMPINCGDHIRYKMRLYSLVNKSLLTTYMWYKVGFYQEKHTDDKITTIPNSSFLDDVLFNKPYIGTRTILTQVRNIKHEINAEFLSHLSEDEWIFIEISDVIKNL